jgi:predicted ATPase
LPCLLVAQRVETIFVGREAQLARLQKTLECVLAGQAQTMFIAGEAGAGKTALLREYARRAQQADSGLVVAVGNCNAQTGLGNPCLPFRKVLRLLTGDVEAEMADNAVNAENANRLRELLVHTAKTS